jgi:hypothetical protein
VGFGGSNGGSDIVFEFLVVSYVVVSVEWGYHPNGSSVWSHLRGCGGGLFPSGRAIPCGARVSAAASWDEPNGPTHQNLGGTEPT